MMPNDKLHAPTCLIDNSDDTVPVFDTFSFDLNDKYEFKGLDDNIGTSKRVVRSSNHANIMKPNDDAPEFRG